MLPLWAAAQATRGVSLTEDRVALVIGNAAYKRDPLDNPVNDARLIASRLEQAGFKVTRRENLDRNGMAAALRDFGAALNENTVAVLYYAGHAMQLRDQNYMIPIDAEMRSEDDVGMQGVDLTFIL
ncbi:MAG TPA: caspase family protein, partial [Burkholderiaceae bacterium]|nr:caspase family protein [Burkholderiaceae bacterium]